MSKFKDSFKKLCRGEEGATMVEYGLMLALIAVVCVVAVALIGTSLNTKFSAAADSLAP